MPEEYVAYIISCVCREREREGRGEGGRGGRGRRREVKRNAREGGERGRETTKEEIINFECLGFGRTKLLAFKTYLSWERQRIELESIQ